MPNDPRLSKIALRAATAIIVALPLAGCLAKSGNDVTGSVAGAQPLSRTTETGQPIDELGARYREKPADKNVGLAYANALRRTGQRAQAVAILQRVAMAHPKDMVVMAAYGRGLADAGQFEQALEVLRKAHKPDQPDWTILNAQGAVLDQMGQPDDAKPYYETALKIAPEEPSILSNLGLSYALSRDLKNAEIVLRRAIVNPRADIRVRQNLALVLRLKGKPAEAQAVEQQAIGTEQAAFNAASWKQMAGRKLGG
jgi:Flp pilus assembly protein TadD